MTNLTYRLKRIYVFLPSLALLHCGGAIVEDGSSVGNGGTTGGIANGGRTGLGGKPSTGGYETAPPYSGPTICYGAVPTSPELPCVALSDEYGPVEKDATECVIPVAIPAGYHLNPDWLKLYFDDEDTGKLEIPYVGTQASCPTAGTVGGWYASSLEGAAASIGLCGCSCAAAKKYPVTLNVACAGLGL